MYCALIECDPTLSDAVVKLAVPLLNGTGLDIGVVPSKNVTVPVAAVGVTVALNMSGVPATYAVSFRDSSSSTSVAALVTIWINGAEVAPLKVALPLYWAVMEWLPAPKAEVLKLAFPPLRGRFPEMATAPSKNVTVPVADDGVTPAVKVSEAPNTEGFVPEVRDRIIVGVGLGLLTICDNAADVAPLKVASPLYCAVIECVPTDNVEFVKLAEPAVRGRLPEIAVLPSKNTTDPVAEMGVTVAVKVRESPVRAGLAPAVKFTLTLLLPFTTFWTSAGLTDGPRWLSPV